MPGRNDPCPCGSGKKYKKCCLDRDEASRREEETCPHCGGANDHDLGGDGDPSVGLAAHLDWRSFDFGADPLDPAFEDLGRLIEKPGDDEEYFECMRVTTERLVPPAARARLAAELERRLEAAGLEEDPKARDAFEALTDLHMPAVFFQLIMDLLGGCVAEVRSRPVPEDSPLPVIEEALRRAAAGDLDDGLDAVHRELEPLAAVAWPLLSYRIELPRSPWRVRAAALGILVRARHWEVFRHLLAEFLEGTVRRDPFPISQLPRAARWLVELGDPRTPGNLAFDLSNGQELRPGAREILAEAFRPTGWWDQIEDALRRDREGERVFAEPPGPEDENPEAPPPDAYQDGLDMLRAIDVGPSAAAWRWEDAARLLDPTGEGMDDPVAWLTAPDPGGRIPIVEKHAADQAETHPGFAAWSRRHLVHELTWEARHRLDDGEIQLARQIVRAVLAIDAGYPFAVELARRLRIRDGTIG